MLKSHLNRHGIIFKNINHINKNHGYPIKFFRVEQVYIYKMKRVTNFDHTSLKNYLVNVCMLTVPLHSDKFLLQTNASVFGLGAVLNVICAGEEKPVSFCARQVKASREELLGNGVRSLGDGGLESNTLPITSTDESLWSRLITRHWSIS